MKREYPRLRTAIPDPESLETNLQSDQAAQGITLALKRMLHLMDGLDALPVDPAALGWVSLWSRTVDLLLCAREALVSRSSLAFAACDRVAAELQLHVLLLARARHASSLDIQSLVALAAWQLLEDRRRLELQLRHLDDVYDPQPARNLLADRNQAEAHEAVLDEIPRENEHVLFLQKQNAETSLRDQLARVNWWISDPALESWTMKYKRGAKPTPSLFHFLEPSRPSVRAQLSAIDMEFHYSLFATASARLHGSSVLELVGLSASDVMPLSPTVVVDPDSAVMMTLAAASRSWLYLGHLRGATWESHT